VFTVVELHTEKPLLDVRVFTIPRFTAGAVSIAVAFFLPLRVHLPDHPVLPIREGLLDSLCWCAHAPLRHRGSHLHAHRRRDGAQGGLGSSWGSGCCDGSGSAHGRLHLDAHAAFFGPIIISMVLLSLGLSAITAPATEAVMGALAADQIGAGAAVNNTTRELGGTLGVAALGSVFASAYAPKITKAFAPYPIPRAPSRRPTVSGGSPRRRQPRTERRAAAIASSNFHWVRSRFEDRLHRRCRRGHCGSGERPPIPTRTQGKGHADGEPDTGASSTQQPPISSAALMPDPVRIGLLPRTQ